MGVTTGFVNSAGADIGTNLVDRSYLIDRYPGLADTFRFAGSWGWGNNSNGQLGDNSRTQRNSPVQSVAGGANWKLVAGGGYDAVAAIKTDGTLWSSGHNNYGQLGDNSSTDKSSPVQTVAGGTTWQSVARGGYHCAAIKSDGTLWLWGRNQYGQLGNSSLTNQSSPVQTISGGTNWKLVSCGSYFTAAIKTDGTLWLWGDNRYYGQLGNSTRTGTSSPIQTVASGTSWRQVSCGYWFTAATKTDGTLWLWGRNGYGQLADGTTSDKSSPVQTTAGGTNWKQVMSGLHHTTAIKTDSSLWVWGRNNQGQLGDNSISNRTSPVQTISGGTNWKSSSSGGYFTAAIKTDGTLWTWGYNSMGQLGDNTTASKSSPIQTVSGGTNWMLIASGKYHNLAIRDNSNDYL